MDGKKFEQTGTGKGQGEKEAGQYASIFERLGIDVDLHAEIIKDCAFGALERILDRRAEMDAAGDYDVPLVVVSGEVHEMPAYHLQHMVILAELAKRESRSMVLNESPYNALLNAFTAESWQVPDDAQKEVMVERGIEDTSLPLKADLAFMFSQYAPFGTKLYHNVILKLGLSHGFNDCAYEELSDTLDMNDARTRDAFRIIANVDPKKGHLSGHFAISGQRRFGMEIRNMHMAKMGVNLATRHSPRIIYQRVGNDHVIGSAAEKLRFENSLIDIYKNKYGLPVVALYAVDEYDPDTVLTMAQSNLGEHELYAFDDLPMLSAIYHPMDPDEETEPASMNFDYEEAEYVNTLLDRMGYPEFFMSPRALADMKNGYQDEMSAEFLDWQHQMGMTPL